MLTLRPLFAVALVLASFALTSAPAQAQGLTDSQKGEVEQVVRDYILKNPEIVLEAIQELRRREEEAASAQQKNALDSMKADLTSDPNDPFFGNPDGDVTVVEFFDYRCGYCKRVFDDVMTLIEEDGNIRFVLKEFPVLGPESVFASRAAMAVWLHQRDAYKPFHVAMMSSRGGLPNDKVLDLAKEAGVDVEALSGQMEDPQIVTALNKTRGQAGALGINGTPGFIIGDTVTPGAVPLETLKNLVTEARQQ